ncbi:endolytic transglycosylase MltG [Cellulomonas wangsupingiae]|uniref:Endolytic murein transglycosylase n=1 Tax=Cellulomonas wangsupingiae TaxID=2968085 RepID=A0ABY5KAQ3_9CELL|nr:endolytic transglycosylase MltG [Cellulomonas wangsupingiae]MCC2333197.1 endolytic transglycosylase MltG [Cellulomonas wangsupingiae]MCM0638050.1 endolytic transglycosylase MltG [Cellulomonas wangsupingiae]UUI66909.1 endolytic transglycosylase MltG [Cellulomonas wangsupingiae]
MSNQTEWWAPVRSDESVTELFGGERAASAPGAPEPRRRSRASGRKREERMRKQRRRRSISVLVVALVLVGGAAYVVFSLMGGSLFGGTSASQEVTDYDGPGRPGAPPVVISAGDSGAAMATTLHEAGIVASQDAFRAAFDANPDAALIQPGTYQLLLEMKAEDAVRALLDPKSRVSMKVTIPEGFTAEQIFTRINEVTLISIDELRAAAADPAAIGLPAEAGGQVEGWLFATTYQIEPDTSAAAVLGQMVTKTVETLTAKGVPQDQWGVVLTKASLVEREAKADGDRPMMARAIQNRLDRGMTLDIDAAVAYGLKIPGTQLTSEHTQDPSNPFNTYKHVGLPPTPIASPGVTSIDAVLNPAQGDWVFWVAINLDTGETRFAETYDEHQENVALLRQWQAENSG